MTLSEGGAAPRFVPVCAAWGAEFAAPELDFFLKKLNMRWVHRITPFYETQATPFGSVTNRTHCE
jgi:hypothetical protein